MFLMYPPSLPHRYHHDGLEHDGRLVLVDDDAMSVPFNMSFIVLAKQGPEWTRTFVRPTHTYKVGAAVQAVWRHEINHDAFWLDGTIESAAGHNLVNIPTYDIAWDEKDADSEKQRHGRALVRPRQENTAENDSYETGTHAKYALGREETEGQAAAPAKAPGSKRKDADPNVRASPPKKGKKANNEKSKKSKTAGIEVEEVPAVAETEETEDSAKGKGKKEKKDNEAEGNKAKGGGKQGQKDTPHSKSKSKSKKSPSKKPAATKKTPAATKKKPAATGKNRQKRPSDQPNPFKPKPFQSPRTMRSSGSK
jgi:hypothetical protein